VLARADMVCVKCQRLYNGYCNAFVIVVDQSSGML
jgi:hypothetical protein